MRTNKLYLFPLEIQTYFPRRFVVMDDVKGGSFQILRFCFCSSLKQVSENSPVFNTSARLSYSQVPLQDHYFPCVPKKRVILIHPESYPSILYWGGKLSRVGNKEHYDIFVSDKPSMTHHRLTLEDHIFPCFSYFSVKDKACA